MSACPRTRPDLAVRSFCVGVDAGRAADRRGAADRVHVGRHTRHGAARLLGRSLIVGVRRGDHRFEVPVPSAQGPRALRGAGRVERRS